MKIQKHTAFTLAEVLITLGIIGVVAAMTIPTLMNKTNDLEMKSAWKKAFSELSQAQEQIIMDNGGVDFSDQCNDVDDTCLRDLFVTKIKTTKICGNAITEGCTVSDSKWMDGSSSAFIISPLPAIITSNGYSVKFRAHAKDCSFGYSGIFEYNACGWMQIDVNSLKKPNIAGKDIFFVGVSKNTLIPFGAQASGIWNSNDCTPIGSGQSCSAIYLQK